MAEARQLRTLIVDDEPLAIERLQILCARIPTLHLAGTAADGAAALRLAEALEPDLILLDVTMPGLDGIAVAQALSTRKTRPALIFVTAFDQFAVAAFDLDAVDYLLKPVTPDRLVRAVERVRERTQHQSDTATPTPAAATPWTQEFWVPHRGELIRIAARDIELIEAERDYMRLHVGARSYLLHATIGELERRLDPACFLRLHRSTIVRRDQVTGLSHDGAGGWEARLSDGKSRRIGRTYLAGIRAMAGRG